mmetsp:Transcript_3830/g.6938  ORF Transcript_3830/g.6938 Transcript_3830/m.6938 type:complete len:257 (-) Transcript_3830:8-778(-)
MTVLLLCCSLLGVLPAVLAEEKEAKGECKPQFWTPIIKVFNKEDFKELCKGYESEESCGDQVLKCTWAEEEEEEVEIPGLWAILLGLVMLLKCCRDECRRGGGCCSCFLRYCCCCFARCRCCKCCQKRRCCRCSCFSCLCCKRKKTPDAEPLLDGREQSTTEPMASLESRFETACTDVWALDAVPTNSDLLELYGLYKQATEGDIPSVVENRRMSFVAGGLKDAAKRESWATRKGMPRRNAMKKYIAKVDQIKREA